MMKKINFLDTNTWIAITAIIVSSCALVVSIVQTKIMKDQKAASSWPFVQWNLIRGWNNDSTGVFKIVINNKGIGPAIIEKLEYQFNNKSYKAYQLENFIADISKPFIVKELKNYSVSYIQGSVLAPNESINHFESIDSLDAMILAKNIKESDFNIIINYRDVYGNKWEYKANTDPLKLLMK